MADIFVDPTAVTNGTGSFANPRNLWPTSIGANDTINLLGGTRLTVAAQLSLGGGSDNIVRGYYPAGPAPRPRITSTAGNQSLLFVARPGVTTFDGIHFDECRNMAANGGAIGTGDNGSGRHASMRIIGCRFTGVGVNAILLNCTTTANAPLTFQCLGTEFDDIGADCVFGGAMNYEFGWNRCTRMSVGGAFGDGVGFINADPNFVWVHNNFIDHSLTDSKQCIIIDTTTPGTGVALIEDNFLIGWGSATATPTLHTVIISDPVTTIRRNVILTYGLTCGINWAGDKVQNNLFVVGNCDSQVASIVGDGAFDNNTFVAVNALNPARAAVVMGTGATASARVRNNAFVNMPIGIQSNVVGVNPTVGGNAYWNVTTPRTGSGGPFAEASAVTANPLLSPEHTPMAGSPLLSGGVDLGNVRDIQGRLGRRYIGAYSVASFRRAA